MRLIKRIRHLLNKKRCLHHARCFYGDYYCEVCGRRLKEKEISKYSLR